MELEKAKKYWKDLKDIPINENEEIDKDFKGFPKGTCVYEIWQYIEDTFNVSIAKDLMKL